MHVVWPGRLVGHHGVEVGVHAIARIGARYGRRIGEVVLRQVREQPAHGVHRVRLVHRREMRDPAPAGVHRRAAQRLGVHDLVRHGAHDVGAGDEHVARPLDHHGEVGHRGRVDRSARARPEDHRDLGHDARGEDVAQEDLRVAAERRDALLDPRTAGVVEPDDRCPDLHREIHDLADLLGVRLGQRAAEDREVLAVDEHQATVDGAVTRDHAVAEDALPVEPELRRAVRDERVELDERVRVQQQVQSFARRQLARGVLALGPLRSPTRPGFRAQLLESRHPLRVGRHVLGSLRCDVRCPCAKTSVVGTHHRRPATPRPGPARPACQGHRDRPPGVLSRHQRPVSGCRGAPLNCGGGLADIHRTVHNSVIVWTTSTGAPSSPGVGFDHFRRPAGVRHAPGSPR